MCAKKESYFLVVLPFHNFQALDERITTRPQRDHRKINAHKFRQHKSQVGLWPSSSSGLLLRLRPREQEAVLAALFGGLCRRLMKWCGFFGQSTAVGNRDPDTVNEGKMRAKVPKITLYDRLAGRRAL